MAQAFVIEIAGEARQIELQLEEVRYYKANM